MNDSSDTVSFQRYRHIDSVSRSQIIYEDVALVLDLELRKYVGVESLHVGWQCFMCWQNANYTLLSEVILDISDTPTKFLPAKMNLEQNYPNPFNPETKIQYEVKGRKFVSLKVYDVLGREVATLVDGIQDEGFKSVRWDATGMASGVYFYRLQAGTFVEVKKMLLLR